MFILASLLWTAGAYGHGADAESGKGTVRVVLDALPPELAALRVQLRRTLAPQLLVANPTDQPLTVSDEQGRAFLRIGPEATEGDLGAAAFHRSNTLMAPGTIPADASGKPRWTMVEATPNWGWFDLRLRTDPVDVPHSVVDAGKRATVGRWSVSVTLGGTASAIAGHFEYVPPARGIAQAQVTDTGALQGLALVRAMPGSARPGVFVSYRGNKPLTLMGAEGEPFLKFSRNGVETNLHSPTWATVAPPGSPGFVAAAEGAGARWASVSRSRSYGWIEPRAASAGPIEDADRPQVIKHWNIPLRIGDTASRIDGVTRWVPVANVAAN
ncbi:hypothetical protein [Marinobacter sp. C2H3]|uniref:hypothetical protein n=1 Tax=Marinobacter sp. C2H3 TaxID=3119003 RepID=UPI00300F0AD2